MRFPRVRGRSSTRIKSRMSEMSASPPPGCHSPIRSTRLPSTPPLPATIESFSSRTKTGRSWSGASQPIGCWWRLIRSANSTTQIRPGVRRIGCVGSEYLPNVDGLRWFLDAIWPRIADPAVELGIYGGVAGRLDAAALPPNARCHGTSPISIPAYRTFDIAINPVRVGGGLKIKTVEALGAGLPLVTTPEGARGLRDAAGVAFLLARDADEFAAHLAQLIASRELRQQLAAGARRLAAERFGAEVCFEPLLRAIERNP